MIVIKLRIQLRNLLRIYSFLYNYVFYYVLNYVYHWLLLNYVFNYVINYLYTHFYITTYLIPYLTAYICLIILGIPAISVRPGNNSYKYEDGFTIMQFYVSSSIATVGLEILETNRIHPIFVRLICSWLRSLLGN